MDRLSGGVLYEDDASVFGLQEGNASNGFLCRRDHRFRTMSHSVEVGASLGAREDVYVRTVAANHLARPYQVRVYAFRGRVHYNLYEAKVGASRGANGARDIFFIASRRVTFVRLAFGTVRHSGHYTFQRYFRGRLTPFCFIYIGTVGQLPRDVRGMVYSVRCVVGEARASSTGLVLRPFQALYGDGPFRDGAYVA